MTGRPPTAPAERSGRWRNRRTARRYPGTPAYGRPGTSPGIGANQDATTIPFHSPEVRQRGCPCWNCPIGPHDTRCGAACKDYYPRDRAVFLHRSRLTSSPAHGSARSKPRCGYAARSRGWLSGVLGDHEHAIPKLGPFSCPLGSRWNKIAAFTGDFCGRVPRLEPASPKTPESHEDRKPYTAASPPRRTCGR